MLSMLVNLINQVAIIPEYIISPLIGISVIIAFVTVVWQVSKKQTTTENNITHIGTEATKDKLEINARTNDLEKLFHRTISDMKVEIKTELLDRISGVQGQIDAMRSDLKDASNRVTIVNTKVDQHEKAIEAVHYRLDKLVDFFKDWNQRVEDRVEAAKREIMGFMNMLINFSNRTRGRASSA
jgi:chromosome segregation ATPase